MEPTPIIQRVCNRGHVLDLRDNRPHRSQLAKKARSTGPGGPPPPPPPPPANLFQFIASALTDPTASPGENGSQTTEIDATGATLLVGFAATFNGGSYVFSDNYGNTWTLITYYPPYGPSDAGVDLWWCAPAHTGPGYFAAAYGMNCYSLCGVAAFNGPTTPLPYQQSKFAGPTFPQSDIEPGPITPPLDNCLLVTALNDEDVGNPPLPSIADPTWTVLSVNQVSEVTYGGGLAWKIQTAAATENPQWEFPENGDYAIAAMADFLPT